jgi:hypothetical protein
VAKSVSGFSYSPAAQRQVQHILLSDLWLSPVASSAHSDLEISKTESRFVSLNTWRTAKEGATSLR